MKAVGSVGGVIHRIQLQETGIGSASRLKVRIVLQGHVGKAIGIKDKVAGDRLSGDLAAARDGVGAVGDFINGADLPRVERSDRGNNRGVRKDRIARAGRLNGKHFPNQARLQTANRISLTLTPMAFTP